MDSEELDEARKAFKPTSDEFEWLRGRGSGWQFGESGILKAIVDKIGGGSERYAEVGAGDGTDNLPVTLDWAYGRAWRLDLHEANVLNHVALQAKYPKARLLGECRSLEGSAYGDGVVVIDIDSRDWWLFASLLNNQELPRIVMVEHWNGPDDQTPSPLRMRCDSQATWRQLCDLAEGLMTPIGRTLLNTIFVRNDLVGALA